MMETNKNYFYLLEKNSDVFIEGDKENRTLKIIDINKEGVHLDFLDDNKDVSTYLSSFIFELLIKKIKKQYLKKKTFNSKEIKDLHNIITKKGDNYYQLIVDSNNFTYELKKYKSMCAVTSVVTLEDFVFDLFLETLIDSKFISISKNINREIVLEGINGCLSYSSMKFLMQYPFEKGNYYIYEAIEKQIKAYHLNEISLDYFKLWCDFVSKALTYNLNNNEYYYDISNLLKYGLIENEETTHFLYAALKYLNHKIINDSEEFSTNGIIRIVSYESTKNTINLFNVLIIDTNKKTYNYEKMICIEFNNEINYKIVDLKKIINLDYEEDYYTSTAKYFDIYLESFKTINNGIYKLDENLF